MVHVHVIGVLATILGVATIAFYRCFDHMRALRRNADDIIRVHEIMAEEGRKIPVIAKILIDMKLMRRDIGQSIIAAGMIDGTGTQTRPYPANSFSFVQISDPNVLLWTLKPAEDGISRGIVARVWNQGNSPANYTMGLSQPILTAERLTHIETTIGPATVTSGQLNASINQQQIQTHLLKITP